MSAAVYIVVALAAMTKAPHDSRVRVFQLVAATNVVQYLVAVWLWTQGAQAEFTKTLVLATTVDATVGTVTLFHFAQVFPWRRPWIREHLRWLVAAYALCPIAMGGLVLAAPAQLDEITPAFAIVALLIGLPGLALLTVVLPVAGLVSLYKSYLTSKQEHLDRARIAALGILVSQLFGGILAVLILPLLHVLLPTGPWLTLAAAIVFAFEIMMPVFFAAAIWRFDVLQVNTSI